MNQNNDFKNNPEIHTLDEFCQSCSIPLSDETVLGTNKDGSYNKEYCKYCYKDGDFIEDCSMEEMKEICLKHLVEGGVDKVEANKLLTSLLPHLKRWQK